MLSCSNEEGESVPDGLAVESTANAITITAVAEENEDKLSETLELFQNVHS